MSKLDRMQIQGIRSFAPNKPESITFLMPLTLILGDNGSGKTTLIEALKYVTTGGTPSGTDGGRTFIHDPKLSNEHRVKGQVKLRVYDVAGKEATLSRTMEATEMPGNKPKMTTLDNTISRIGKDGKPYSISGKCADINTEIVSILGVSKPILDNVIFCHQDDSNWPLDEAKKVKDKFDDIFNATSYIKCQDLIRKQVKDIREALKLKQLELKFLAEKKMEAEAMSKELESYKLRLANNESDLHKFEEQKKPLKDKLKQLESEWRKVDKLEDELKEKQIRLHAVEQQMKNLEESLQMKFTGTDEELRRAMEDFGKEKHTQAAKLAEKEREVQRLDREIKATQQQKHELSLRLGKLLSEEQNHEKRIKSRDRNIRDMATQIGLEDLPSEGNLSDLDVNSAFAKLADAAEHQKDVSKKLKSDWEVQEKKLRDEHDKFRDESRKLKDGIEFKEAEVKKNRKEMLQLEKELQALESAAAQLHKLESSLTRAKMELEDMEKVVNLNELSETLSQSKQERENLESELTDLRKELMKLHELGRKRAHLELLERNLDSKKTDMRKLKGRLEEKLMHLLSTIPESNLKSHFEAHLARLKSDIAERRAQEADQNTRITKLQTELTHSKALLLQKQNELRSLTDKLKEKCRTTMTLDQEIAKVGGEVAELQNRLGSFSGSEHIYNRYLQSLRNAVESPAAEACCPLCIRPFQQTQEAKELMEEIEHNLSQLPQKKQDCEKTLKDKKIRHETLLKLQPVQDQIVKLNQEIPELERKCDSQDKQLSELLEGLEDLKATLECVSADEAVGREIQGDVHTLDLVTKDVKKLEQEVDEEKSRLGSALVGLRAIEVVEAEVKTVEEKYEKQKALYEQQDGALEEHKNRMSKLKENVNKITTLKLKSSEALQQRSNVEKKHEALKNRITELENEMEAAERNLVPVLEQMKASEKNLQDGLKRKEKELEAARKQVEFLQRTQDEWTGLDTDIKSWVGRGKADLLEREKERRVSLDAELRNTEEKRTRFQAIVDQLKSAISKQEVEERNLKDNELLRLWERDLKSMNVEMAALRTQIVAASKNKIEADLKSLQENIGGLDRQRAKLQGAQGELEEKIRDLEGKLREEGLKDAELRHRKKFFDFKTTELVAEDLTKYTKALEWAVLNFHQERMKAINAILRELWANTYRGNDIDYIQIQTDESASNTSTGKRRNYIYRVIMVKQGVPMDMRGRCSAGQKMLASLLIRMALAETFSSQCGVLALDEPTTNLDKANIDSLIDTLIDIAKRYAHRKNLQMIIITHDENFVERMTREAGCERYFRVSRKQGVSQIRMCSVDVVEESR